MKTNKALICLMLMGSLIAHNSDGETQLPQQKKQFNLSYYDIREDILERASFDIRLSDTIIDKVLMLDFKPALQNGRPVRVRYKLPILFK